MKAVDADGLESAWSEPAFGTTKPLPDAPTELAAEWTDDGAFVRWDDPLRDGSSVAFIPPVSGG